MPSRSRASDFGSSASLVVMTASYHVLQHPMLQVNFSKNSAPPLRSIRGGGRYDELLGRELYRHLDERPDRTATRTARVVLFIQRQGLVLRPAPAFPNVRQGAPPISKYIFKIAPYSSVRVIVARNGFPRPPSSPATSD